jgi:type III secretion system YscQ/HrcQ family protein
MKKDEKLPPDDLGDFGDFEDFEDSTAAKEPEESGKTSAKAEEKVPAPKIPKPPPKTAKPVSPPAPPKPAVPKEEPAPLREEVLQMSKDIPVQLVAVIGRTTVSVKELMTYQMGQVIDLNRPPSETVDVVASGKLFARGELVDIDGKLGVRIVKLVK